MTSYHHKPTWEQREEEMKICLIEQGFAVDMVKRFGENPNCCGFGKWHIPVDAFLKMEDILSNEEGIFGIS